VNYEIKLPQFEGPFDLLLFFIERDELDIYDIPIAHITHEFLAFIKTMESLNLEIASEFILVASTLMRIKAKMLLPRPDIDESGTEIDPRKDLIDRLVEYKRFKEASEKLGDLEAKQALMHQRGNILEEWNQFRDGYKVQEELSQIDLYRLLKAFQNVIERKFQEENKPKHTITPYPYQIDDKKNWLINLVNRKKKIGFHEIFKSSHEKMEAIFTFLALLDLIQQQQISIVLGEGFNSFWIEIKTETSHKSQ
jgi:segregation and condensation protein A